MRLLLVEDNAANRQLAHAVLKRKGHVADDAGTAPEAIAALERGPLPDIVLLDIDVPGGGLSVVSHVRATPAMAGLTVIAFTALAMRGDRERFIAVGCDGYISKPIDVRTFVDEIESIHAKRAR